MWLIRHDLTVNSTVWHSVRRHSAGLTQQAEDHLADIHVVRESSMSYMRMLHNGKSNKSSMLARASFGLSDTEYEAAFHGAQHGPERSSLPSPKPLPLAFIGVSPEDYLAAIAEKE